MAHALPFSVVLLITVHPDLCTNSDYFAIFTLAYWHSSSLLDYRAIIILILPVTGISLLLALFTFLYCLSTQHYCLPSTLLQCNTHLSTTLALLLYYFNFLHIALWTVLTVFIVQLYLIMGFLSTACNSIVGLIITIIWHMHCYSQ